MGMMACHGREGQPWQKASEARAHVSIVKQGPAQLGPTKTHPEARSYAGRLRAGSGPQPRCSHSCDTMAMIAQHNRETLLDVNVAECIIPDRLALYWQSKCKKGHPLPPTSWWVRSGVRFGMSERDACEICLWHKKANFPKHENLL